MKFSEPIRLKKLLQGYKGIWMVAGGWAIDLYLNKETRHHHDIENCHSEIRTTSITGLLARLEITLCCRWTIF